MTSGADTTLKGAQLAGRSVAFDIGDLLIQTRQHSIVYDSQQSSSGFSLSVCIPQIYAGVPVTGRHVKPPSARNLMMTADSMTLRRRINRDKGLGAGRRRFAYAVLSLPSLSREGSLASSTLSTRFLSISTTSKLQPATSK